MVGWVDRQEQIEKLRLIHSQVCGIDLERSRKEDIITILLQIINEYYNTHQYHRLLTELFERRFEPCLESRRIKNIDDTISFLLVRISLLRVVDEDGNKIMELGENDEEIEKLLKEEQFKTTECYCFIN